MGNITIAIVIAVKKNLQPLWAFDNMRKHNKLEETFQPSLKL